MAKKFDTECENPNTKLLVFQALADEKRLKVLDIIRDGEQNGTYLRNELDIPQSSLSYHMKLLCDSGIVLARNQGKSTYYRINGAKSHNEADLLSDLLTDDSNEDGDADNRHSFLFGMSHNVRTPMNAVLGYVEMAKKHIDEKDKVMGFLDKIELAGNQLMTMMEEVLQVARLASGDTIVEEMPADMRYAGREISDNSREMAMAKNIDFAVHVNHIKNPKVYCDYINMNEVLQRVVDNAIQFTNPGGHVSLTVEQVPCNLEGYGNFRFTVRDDGVGMSEDFLPYAFDAFTREIGDVEGMDRGPGLGLTIAKKLLGLIGGSIDIVSQKGVGTTVTIHTILRLQSDEVLEEDLEEPALSGKRVLLVEDNDMSREILKDMLEDEGLKVEEAVDGDVAVAMVTDAAVGYYDAVLMDIVMPRMDGYTASRLIRHLPDKKKAAVPIIAVTANTLEQSKRSAKAAGMNSLCPKPINRKNIRETLQKFILAEN